jgi:hypothetical protein
MSVKNVCAKIMTTGKEKQNTQTNAPGVRYNKLAVSYFLLNFETSL